ncbi:hypothetical protein CPB84DRAFT_1683298 [Gymnopilus junonius]|uniref:Uncharacterized protein n=1 Tax=Gymnopilus junonius TaxID=109634 RepID=A0A9P5NJ49_GYMJU|nr:hypothetical protein CPB84DRAFT_1683298 [Gymnopilus junonius]
MQFDLPAEIWTQIFDLAADEDILFQPGIPTGMAESAWAKDRIINDWRLRSPQEAMNMLQRRSYATKKAIILTCRRWRELGSEFLFRCLYFSDPAKLLSLCSILDSSAASTSTVTASYGWWTRRIHVSELHPSPTRNVTMEDLENALASIVRHCPNVEIVIVEKPMGPAFGPVADALATYAFRKLHTVQFNLPGDLLSKVIWALDALPLITSACIVIDSPVQDEQECAHLGSATDMRLELPFLQQLSLKGHVGEFVEQAAGWDLPSLRSLSLDGRNNFHDPPDIVEFLKQHGLPLLLLDIDYVPPLDVATILELCPNLLTFSFNADWRLPLQGEAASKLTKHPHQNIATIGLYGLSTAFGVGAFAATGTGSGLGSAHTLLARVSQRSNEWNVAALTRDNFPKLRRVRALSRPMLRDLNRFDGPSRENGGYDRWNKWWNQFADSGIRMEDCTGQFLGTLPQDDEDESSEEEDDDEDSEDEYEDSDDGGEDDEDGGGDGGDDFEDEDSDEADGEGSRGPPLPEGNGRTMELTRLLQEVRAMNESRDEELIARVRIPGPPSPSQDAP